MKGDLKSLEGFLKIIIDKGGNANALSKREKKGLVSLVNKMDAEDKVLCPRYQTEGVGASFTGSLTEPSANFHSATPVGL